MAYNSDTSKIDSQAVSGLSGVSNSLAYKVHEIEKHFHNYERWYGKSATNNATIDFLVGLHGYTA